MANALTNTVKVPYGNNRELVDEYTWTFTGDDGDGSIDPKDTEDLVIGWVFMIETNPGAVAPDANWGATIVNEAGADILGGVAANNRSATLSERLTPKIGAAYGESWVNSILTLNVADNTVNSATGVVKIWVRKAHLWY